MRNLLFFLFFLFSFIKIPAQLDIKIAQGICDTLRVIKGSNSAPYAEPITLRADVNSIALKNIPIVTLKKEKNVSNFINVLSYKVRRNLKKNCKLQIIIENNQFSPLTSVVDFDEVFTLEQFKTIRDKIRKIRIDKSVDLLVLEVDDFYPFQEITPYSFEILNNWSSGLPAEKGKIIIVFSKNLRQARISTNSVATNFIEDELVQNIIDDKIIPNFKAGNYYQGILETLNKIEEKL